MQETEQAAVRGLTVGAGAMEADMRQSSAYENQTGATRSSTVAVVVSRYTDAQGRIRDAEGVAASLNPGETQLEAVILPGHPDDPAIVATVPTTYQADLENRNAGEQAVLGPALIGHAGPIFDQVVRELKRTLGGS